MPVTDLPELVKRLTGGTVFNESGSSAGNPQNVFFQRGERSTTAALTAPVAGRWSSLWTAVGEPPHGDWPGVAPSNPTNATSGALAQTDASGANKLWCLGGAFSNTQAGDILVYDRLLHISGLNGTSVVRQAVGGTITRNVMGSGNEPWVEIYQALGASSTTGTVQYINCGGGTSTSPAFPIGNTGFNEAQRIIRVPLQAGDGGVREVLHVRLAATTATAGNFGVTVARPLFSMPSVFIGVGYRDLICSSPGPVQIDTGACLALAMHAVTTTVPAVLGNLMMVEA